MPQVIHRLPRLVIAAPQGRSGKTTVTLGLCAALRARGGCVAWVQMELADGPDSPSTWPLYHEYFFSTARAAAHKLGCTRGSEGVKIYKDLDVDARDIITHKKRFSAFIQGSSDLHERLQGRAIRNLLIAGTVTNFCCETSARDAMMLDYRVAMVSDACAACHEKYRDTPKQPEDRCIP